MLPATAALVTASARSAARSIVKRVVFGLLMSGDSLADYFCQLARRRIEVNFDSITNNDDIPTNQIAKRIVNKEFKWLEEGVIPVGPED